ncbi:hypothetical protein B194_0723 [Serratia plymuthica A30]|nr:hypothetical protein B194_0723 [Serratia plymuthica A30]
MSSAVNTPAAIFKSNEFHYAEKYMRRKFISHQAIRQGLRGYRG